MTSPTIPNMLIPSHASTKYWDRICVVVQQSCFRLLKNQEVQATCFRKSVTISDKAQIASYKVAELIALKQKPHDIAESLILPACLEIVKIMFGNEAQRDVLKIPVSDDTIKRRIIDMLGFIENAVTAKLSTKNFALQIDESTDISGKAQLIGFIRFVDDTEIKNQFLFCKELIGHATGEDIFNSVSSYLEEWKLSWENCAGICTDGAPAMRGSIKGFCSRVKAINSNIVSTHCFLHRESLISKSLPSNLKSVLEQVVHMTGTICNNKKRVYCLKLRTELNFSSQTLLKDIKP
ncbi:zinc finger BED domain-containing protein 5-like [Cylas formicarius]|uniref:zinc finger BED domain-containing protein 5-like n=1 Tax=Cylas formicarius TaxID=197179 RepID=UPI0029585FE1|nr:zinc finger BED domain-containing protein 5-like [Cylas formicarius]